MSAAFDPELEADYGKQSDTSDPIVGLPPDLVVEDMVVGQSAETWHLPRDVWRPIRQRVTGKLCHQLGGGLAAANPVDVGAQPFA